MKYVISCYGSVVEDAIFDDADLAKEQAEEHIRTCPEGAMPWALDITWHEGERFFSAAAGEWLDHWVRKVPD